MIDHSPKHSLDKVHIDCHIHTIGFPRHAFKYLDKYLEEQNVLHALESLIYASPQTSRVKVDTWKSNHLNPIQVKLECGKHFREDIHIGALKKIGP